CLCRTHCRDVVKVDPRRKESRDLCSLLSDLLASRALLANADLRRSLGPQENLNRKRRLHFAANLCKEVGLLRRRKREVQDELRHSIRLGQPAARSENPPPSQMHHREAGHAIATETAA